MAFGFHGGTESWLALARFVTRLDFVDDVDLAATTDDLTGRVTLLGGFDGGNNFHKTRENRERFHLCQTNSWPGTVLV